MSTISELLIKIGADSSGLRKELGESKTAIHQTFGDVKPLDTMQGALTSTTSKVEGLIGSFTKFAGVVAGGFGLTSLISGAVTAGESVYQLSKKMGVTVAQAGEFKRILALTGGDADTASAAIMRLDKSMAGGGASAQKTQQIFDALGVSLKDQQGHLLPLNQQLEQLAKGYQAAEKAGYGQEFIMNTLGARGLSLTQTLRDYAEAKENAAKVKSSGMIDAQQMHELDQQIKLANMQFGQLKVAGGAALAPLAKEFLPLAIDGLSKAAVFIKENSTQIKTLTTDLVKLYAVYKSIQAVRAIGAKATTAVKSTIGKALGGNAEVVEAEKTQEEITKVQQRAITRRLNAMQAAANKEIKEYEKTVQKMEVVEAEKTRLVTEFATKRIIALEEAQAKERAAMEKTFLSYQTQKVREAEIAAETEQAKAASAEKAAAQIAEANTAAGASTSRIVEGNARAAGSEVAKADAATVASGRIIEANAAAQGSIVETTGAQNALTASEVATGAAAGETAAKKVTAENVSKAALAGTKVEQEALTAATAVTGATAMGTGSKIVGAMAIAQSGVATLTGAVWRLMGGWLGVAAAIAYAAYCLYQFAHQKQAEIDAETYVTSDGSKWHHKLGSDVWEADPGNHPEAPGGITNVSTPFVSLNMEDAGFEAPATSVAELNRRTTPDADQQAELDQMAGERWLETPQGMAWAAEQKAAQAESDMSGLLANVTADIPAGTGAGGAGGSGGASAAVNTTPTRTKWSFEDDPELAAWQNEIRYAGSYWGLDPALIAAIIKAESHGQSDIWSSDHAHWGLGQISKDIADTYGGGRGFGEGSDPNDNIMAAAGYLQALLTQYGNVEDAISAYNLGHANPGANPGYVSQVEGYYNAITTSQVPVTGGQSPQAMTETPIGISIYDEAAKNIGEQLGANTCAHFVSYLAQGIGANTGVISDRVKDWVDVAKQNGAWVDASSGQTAPKGSLTVWSDGAAGNPWAHIGVSDGAGGWIASDTHGVKHSSGLDSYYNGYRYAGYIDMDRLTGGQTVKTASDASQRAASEAAKRVKRATDEANKMLAEMRDENEKESGHTYQQEYLKLMNDIADKAAKIRKLQSEGAPTTSIKALKSELDVYSTSAIEKFRQKWTDAYADLYDTSQAELAKTRHDYEAEADYEYSLTVRKLNRELEEKKKALMHDEDDVRTRMALEDKYYAQLEEAEDKRRKARQEAHEKYVSYLTEEGNLAMLIHYMGTPKVNADGTRSKSDGEKRGEESINIAGQKALAKEYVKLWQAAHGSMAAYIANVSDTLYSTMSDSMMDFIRGTKSAKSALQDFGNAVLNMMAKIAAQRLAASWMSSIFGAFGGGASAWSWGGVAHDSSFGISSVTDSLANTASATSSILNVPKFATGGIVTAPTLAMIGEGGDHEAVIPLNDHNLRVMGGNSGGKGGVVVNITNKSNSEVSVQKSGFNEDIGKWVLDIVVDGAQRNRGGFGRNLKTALKGTM